MKKIGFMGIDIGTTGIRAAMFDENGSQAGMSYKEYPMICNEPGMSELEPDAVFGAMLEVVKGCKNECSDYDISAIGFSTQMHSFMAVDSNGNCLTNLLTWADSRPMAQAEYIEKNFDYMDLYSKTGCRVQHPMYPLSKVLWLKQTKPDLFGKAYKFITIKEYILYKLFNVFAIDITDASATACFNIHKFCWDKDILDILGVGPEMFGTPVECTHILRNIKKEYADIMQIDPKIPVVIGSGDGIMANVGCGVFDDTSMSCTIGTSGALRIAVPKPLIDPNERTWCYCFTHDTWVAGGAINNGGIVLRWLRNEYMKQYEYEVKENGFKNVYKLFDHYAEEIKPGSDGLIFLPYLTGERSPGWNAGAKGTITGLQLLHGKKHFVRAAMEGVMYNMFTIYNIITQLNSNVRQIKGNGGYVHSAIWMQIQADIFGKDIAVAGVGEASAFGAAYTAMAAVGAIKDLHQKLPVMEPSKIVKPIQENVEAYKKYYKNFSELYDKLVK